MRLRAKMTELSHIKRFDAIISAISKIAKLCVMRISEDRIYLIMSEASSLVGGPSVWAEMEQESLFNEFNMEGVSDEYNEIFLEFSPDIMHKNVTSLKSPCVKDLKIRLTKKNAVPNLTFEVSLASVANTRQVVHDIPVQTVPRRVWKEYTIPELPPVHVSLCLQDLKKFKIIVDKYRTIGPVLTLTARKDGSLTLKVDSDDVTVSGHFKDLRVPVLRNVPWRMEEEAPMDVATVRVDIRRLNQFLFAELLNPVRVVINVVDDVILHIAMVTQEIVLQFFLPKTNRS